MRSLGELSLLVAFVSSGFAAFACVVGWQRNHRTLRSIGAGAALVSMLALTSVTMVLAWALIEKDFRFAYVAQYSSELLPWYYSLSALWVGQAGSLLLWAWLSGGLAILYGFWPRRGKGVRDLLCEAPERPFRQEVPDTSSTRLREPALGVLMGYLCFLVAIMVFAADPMEPSISAPRDGAGLSPLLQHPAMLIHPPVVFLGYALWAVPFALALVALATGQLDSDWVRRARPWALSAWIVLGAGILLGAEWAYEELGWGGYWSWDPVENGSLIPWLTGTALIHVMMTWQYRGAFKKTAVSLAIATFGLCNFATFLTRSGIFSSLHAFSESPIGWLFLVLMLTLAVGGGVLVFRRRTQLTPDKPISSILSREAFVLLSTLTLLLMTVVTIAGTLSTALSGIFLGRTVMMGPAFYNNVLIPTGLVLLAATAMAPLLRWGAPPTSSQKKWLFCSMGAGSTALAISLAFGIRHPIELAVHWLAFAAVIALVGALFVDARRRQLGGVLFGTLRALRDARRQYAGFLIHMGFVGLAVGVTGSSLGTREQEFVIREGETVQWAGRHIRLARLNQRQLPDKLVGEAELEISRDGRQIATLSPAQHFHLLQRDWTTEVAIHSTWAGDFYAILHSGEGQQSARMTFVENPMMRWLWFGGWVMGIGTLIRLWPAKRRRTGASSMPVDKEKLQPDAIARRAAAASLLLAVGLTASSSVRSPEQNHANSQIAPTGPVPNGARLSLGEVSGTALAAGFAWENIAPQYRWLAPFRSQSP